MNRPVVFLLGLLLMVSKVYAQTLTVSGEVTKPLTLQAAELKAMPHTDVTSPDRDGKEHRYSGVPVIELLKQAGISTGSELRGKHLTKYAVVKAADGYEVVFALPELDPAFATRTILLADSVDGTALPAGTGPYRVIVPGEKKPTRWVRVVKAIEVRIAE
ncbi:molybdopterin-dependent oxidoreductase [Spirosoma taeanense]|uniref:Molybdopterin-dependent oxidoreductase n=1 Tax=Spirosoma taeanense TaxID=2735870 RepID=A0A6M5Y7R6_9BACT|nr:molybdopterin-dependent oxidoreductase [Spirosoma taeanense]QJW89153.1 molybdopterin-dependent oxidoreductase [Spirosoma taeanense]